MLKVNENINIHSPKGFLGTPVQFLKNGVKREKHPVCGSPVGENALLMLEIRGEWAD